MKKKGIVTIFVFFIFFNESSFSQEIEIKAGMNLSNMAVYDDETEYSKNFLTLYGYHVGLTAGFPIMDHLTFEPGLLLNKKGFQYKTSTRISLLYIDVPLNVRAAFNAGEVTFFSLAGPYIGMGLGGKDGIEKNKSPIIFGSDFKRLDYGLSVSFGIEVRNNIVGITYGWGLANISTREYFTSAAEGASITNRVLSVSLGYRFNKSKDNN